eukprot:2990392-Lingulodinium_polyedra.AAC.1
MDELEHLQEYGQFPDAKPFGDPALQHNLTARFDFFGRARSFGLLACASHIWGKVSCLSVGKKDDARF